MSRHRSLRLQLTAGATVLVALVVGIAGLVISVRISQQDRSRVDTELVERADKVVGDLQKEGLDVLDQKPDEEENADRLLAGNASLVRLLVAGAVVDQRGEIPDGAVAVPSGPGRSTVQIDGAPWRSLVVEIGGRPDALLEVLQPLAPVEERLAENRRLIGLVTAMAVLITALVTWLFVGLTLRPLERLRHEAVDMPSHGDSDLRFPEPRHPTEVADLAATLNSMLSRLQASTDATRRFAADAGHELRAPLTALGFDLETLAAHPDLGPAQRTEMVTAMAAQQRRLSELLDGLLTLTRGDAEVLPSRSIVDLGELVDDIVSSASHRGHEPRIIVEGTDEPLLVSGWPEGIRLAIANLVDNALRHGRQDGHVKVTTRSDGDRVQVTISDNGPGIPPDQRERLVERFTRGATAAPGSGLGLAIASQQAELHGGALVLGTSEEGGLRADITFPATR